MVRTVTKRAKDAIVDAAQGVRTMAGDALGAATKAAADVVFETTANALESGRARLRRATPEMENALGNAARRSVTRSATKRKPGRRKAASARKRGGKQKAVSRKKAAKAKRGAGRRRSR